MKTLFQRFEEKYTPEPNTGCWLWTAAGDRYGQIAWWDGRTLAHAHRVAWELYRGPLLAEQKVLHRCDVTWCVNPDHLFLGTQSDNMADMARKGRHRIQRGFKQPWQKLDATQIAAIRAAVGRHADIAATFGITRSRVSQIKRAA